MILISQLSRLYNLVDAWSNVEFISEKIRDVQLLAALASAITSAWFQIGLIIAGLGWIAIATSAWPRYHRTAQSGLGEAEGDVVHLIQRSLSDHLTDRKRERKAEPFVLVQGDREPLQYSLRDVDALTLTQRERLFAADPEMPAWWRGKSPRTGDWPLFRVKGGIWIAQHQIDQTPEKYHLDLFQGIPGLLDWYMKDRKF
jgi:hypothetical protein